MIALEILARGVASGLGILVGGFVGLWLMGRFFSWWESRPGYTGGRHYDVTKDKTLYPDN